MVSFTFFNLSPKLSKESVIKVITSFKSIESVAFSSSVQSLYSSLPSNSDSEIVVKQEQKSITDRFFPRKKQTW